jgi:large subunit ribosomal protein L29
MKRNDITALHEKSRAELLKQLNEVQTKVAAARLQKTVGKLANPASIQVLRNDIARIKTVLRQQEISAAQKA